jgi:zinc transporter ZupT
MGIVQTGVLGAVAGFTIYFGLPLGKVKGISEKTRSFLSMTSAGILIFLFIDILGQLSKPIEAVLEPVNFGKFIVLLGILTAGFTIGLLGLIIFKQRFFRFQLDSTQVLSPTRLALLIAAGIGLHNFSEGLAIGQSAGRGDIGFAAILISGFRLHNATELPWDVHIPQVLYRLKMPATQDNAQ